MFGEPKRDQLPVWLVSGNERFVIDQENNKVLDAAGAVVATDDYPADYQTPDTILPSPSDDKTIVELVGFGSAADKLKSSDGLDGRVRVKKQDIIATEATGTNRVTGHYAYWVGDESTKANFAVRDVTSKDDSSYPNDVSKTSATYRARLQSPQRVGWQNMSGFGEATFSANDTKLENISTSPEIALLEHSNATAIQDAGKENFHSLTAFSRSLLTDTALGGLKSDLTEFLKTGTGLSPADPIPDRSRYNPQDSRFRAWGGSNTGFPSGGGAEALDGIPTWTQLRAWYQSPATDEGTVTPGKASGIYPTPVQVAFQGAFSYHGGKVRLHWIPMIVLWNPYDVSLAPAAYEMQVSFSPHTQAFYLCKPNATLAELQAADPEANWTGNPADKSSWKFTDTNGVQKSVVLPDPDSGDPDLDSIDTTAGPWPRGALAGGLTDMFGRLFFELKSADSEMIHVRYDAVLNEISKKSSVGPKNQIMRLSPHENSLQPRTVPAAIRRTFNFRITAAFGPGEARVFTVGETQEWKKDGKVIELVNDINLTEMPPSVWFDMLEVVHGPASADAAGLRIFPGLGLSGVGVGTPSVTLSLNGDKIFEMQRFGVLADNVAWTNASGADYKAKLDGEPDKNNPKPTPKFVGSWRPLHDFDSEEFKDHFNPTATTETAATNWSQGGSWVEPFAGARNNGGAVEGGVGGDNIQSYTAAFSRFNLSAWYMDLHPNVDVYRDINYVNNSDGFTKLSYLTSSNTPKWDDDQASGEFAYALLTRRNDPAKIPFLGLSKLAIRNARRAQSEILSLGQFQQVNLSPYYWEPAFPIGNSFASPYSDREAIAGIHSRTVGRANSNGGALPSLPNAEFKGMLSASYTKDVLTPGNLTMDLSYLLNENLWDHFFLSTIDGTPDPAKPLANSRLRFTEEVQVASPSELTDFHTASAWLQNVGALNVNSTSVEAWKALLTAFRGLALGNNPSDTVPVARTLDPISGAVNFHFDTASLGARSDFGNTSSNKDYAKIFSGFRYLDDKMIEALAKRIVDEVRQRGPFLSMSDFVNRRLVAPEGSGDAGSVWTSARTVGSPGNSNLHPQFLDPNYDPFIGLQGLSGALQRAIQLSGINGGVNHPALGDNGSGSSDANDMVYTVRIRDTGGPTYAPASPGWTSAGIGKSGNLNKGHGIVGYGGYRHSQEPTFRSYLDSEHLAGAPAGEAGQLLDGAPSFVTQGDLLAMIGPALTARGDTFLIRSETLWIRTSGWSRRSASKPWCSAKPRRLPLRDPAAKTNGGPRTGLAGNSRWSNCGGSIPRTCRMKRFPFPVCKVLAALLVALSVPAARSQSAAREVPVIELFTLRLGDMEVPSLYYAAVAQGPDGKQVTDFKPVEIGDGVRQGPCKIPLNPPVKLYTGNPREKDGRGMKPWADVPARSPGDRLVLLFYFDSKGQPAHRFLDDSTAAHPASTVRVFNAEDAPVEFSAGNRKVSVLPGTEGVSVPQLDSQGRFDFALFSNVSSHPLPKRLYFPGKAGRLLVVYSLAPEFVPTGKALPDGTEETKRILKPLARRLFDQAPEK